MALALTDLPKRVLRAAVYRASLLRAMLVWPAPRWLIRGFAEVSFGTRTVRVPIRGPRDCLGTYE